MIISASVRSGRRRLPRGVLLLPLLAGCSAIRFGAAPAPDMQGTWTGGFEIQSQRVEGSLAIEQDGARLEAAFTSPAAGIVAEGRGEVTPGGEAWIVFSYDLECPGTARVEGRLDDERSLFSGAMEARDCTGVASGTFTFRR